MVKRKGFVQVAFLLPEELAERLKVLSEQNFVSQAHYFREGVKLVLERHETPGARIPKKKR